MEKILVVDDEIEICDFLIDFLILKGYEVYTASDGYTAINRVKKLTPRLVLLDIVMPEINGVKVLKEIKRLNPGIKVIMVTATPEYQMIIECIDLGADDYIQKPIDLNHVENLVAYAMQN